MKTRTCTICKIEKEENHGNFQWESAINRFQTRCKECRKLYYSENKYKHLTSIKLYRKTELGLFTLIYAAQKRTSKKRNHPLPDYTKFELIDKFINTKKFKNLYKNWVESGYLINLKPSFDRKKNNLPYTFKNLQIMTWEENFKKGNKERFKPVVQMDLKGNFIKEYPSAREAERQTNISNSSISQCCTLKIKTSGGFTWKFKNKN